MAKVKPVVQTNVPVVVTGLLNSGDLGSVVVLANYTYEPIDKLSVDVAIAGPITKATSTNGSPVKMTKIPGGVRLELPLDCTDLVLLQK